MKLKVTDGTGKSQILDAPVTMEEYNPVRWGNTTRESFENAAAITDVDTYYGMKSKVMRLYFTGKLGAPLVTDRDVVVSWKTYEGTQAEADLANSYFASTLVHEINSKFIKGTYNIDTWVSQMQALKAKGVTNLVIIVTADFFGRTDEQVITQKLVDLDLPFVIDFDGVSFSDHYHAWTNEIAAALAFIEKYGIKVVGVGEFGACRATATDADDSARAAWLIQWADAIEAAFPDLAYGCVWEYVGLANSEFTFPATHDAVVELMSR